MKKILVVVLTALTAGIVKKRLDAQSADQRLWAEATSGGGETGTDLPATTPTAEN